MAVRSGADGGRRLATDFFGSDTAWRRNALRGQPCREGGGEGQAEKKEGTRGPKASRCSPEGKEAVLLQLAAGSEPPPFIIAPKYTSANRSPSTAFHTISTDFLDSAFMIFHRHVEPSSVDHFLGLGSWS